MPQFAGHRRAVAVVMVLSLVGAALLVARLTAGGASASPPNLSPTAKELIPSSPGGVENGGAGGESAESHKAQEQFDNARLAPGGIVAPGAYSVAFGDLTGLRPSGTSWNEVTNVPYDADDPDYRDYYSNSSGGSGLLPAGSPASPPTPTAMSTRPAPTEAFGVRSPAAASGRPSPMPCLRSRRAISRSARTRHSGTQRVRRTPAARAM